jgi:16S rRNA U516 pseudouridylate synthase RsuA-like enzyme
LPTLRLIRYRVGPFALAGLAPGGARHIELQDAWRQLDAWKNDTLPLPIASLS